MRLVCYSRVSVDEEDGQNQSILAQAEAAQRFASENGHRLVETFSEPGISGTKSNRPAFRKMLRFASDPANQIDGVVVFSMSRFARSLIDQLEAENILEAAGVSIISLTDSTGEGEEGRFGRAIMGAVNEKYARDAAKATSRSRRQNAQRGYWNGGRIPYGYRTVVAATEGKKERMRLTVAEDEAEIVRLIYSLALGTVDGVPMGTRNIAKSLNERGYTIGGQQWFHSAIDRVLTTEHYAGHYHDRSKDPTSKGGGDPIRVACPAIVSAEMQAAVAASRAKRAPRVTPPRVSNSPTLLGGLARCGEANCGCGLVVATGKGGAYRYYKCNARVNRGGSSCGCPTVRQEVLDEIVLSQLEKRILEPSRLRSLLADVLDAGDEQRQQQQAELKRLQQEHVRCQTAIGNLLTLIETGQMSAGDPIFAHRMAERRAEAESLKTRIAHLERITKSKAPPISDELLEKFSTAVRNKLRSDDKRMREFYVEQLIADVTVSTAGIRIRGSTAALEHAVILADKGAETAVRGFDREWCTSPEKVRTNYSRFFESGTMFFVPRV